MSNEQAPGGPTYGQIVDSVTNNLIAGMRTYRGNTEINTALALELAGNNARKQIKADPLFTSHDPRLNKAAQNIGNNLVDVLLLVAEGVKPQMAMKQLDVDPLYVKELLKKITPEHEERLHAVHQELVDARSGTKSSQVDEQAEAPTPIPPSKPLGKAAAPGAKPPVKPPVAPVVAQAATPANKGIGADTIIEATFREIATSAYEYMLSKRTTAVQSYIDDGEDPVQQLHTKALNEALKKAKTDEAISEVVDTLLAQHGMQVSAVMHAKYEQHVSDVMDILATKILTQSEPRTPLDPKSSMVIENHMAAMPERLWNNLRKQFNEALHAGATGAHQEHVTGQAAAAPAAAAPKSPRKGPTPPRPRLATAPEPQQEASEDTGFGFEAPAGQDQGGNASFDFLQDTGNAPSAPSINTTSSSTSTSRKKKDGKGGALIAGGLAASVLLGGGAYMMSQPGAPTKDKDNQANVRRVDDEDENPAAAPKRDKPKKPAVVAKDDDQAPEFVKPPAFKPPAAAGNPAVADNGKPKGAPKDDDDLGLGMPVPMAPAGAPAAVPAPPVGVGAAPAPAAVAGEAVDPATLPDADARKKYFEDFVASRVVDVTPSAVKNGFIEKDGDKFKVHKDCEMDYFKANAEGDWVWVIYNPSNRDILVMPSANSNLNIALVADNLGKGDPTYHLEVLNGHDHAQLKTPDDKEKHYKFTNFVPTHMLHQTANRIFDGGLSGIHLAASYKSNQVKPGTTKVLDNARSQRPEIELRMPMNNKVVYVGGGVSLNLENPMALPLDTAITKVKPSSSRERSRSGSRMVDEQPAYTIGLQDCYIACEAANAGSIVKRPIGSIDTDGVSGTVAYNDANKEYFMDKVGAIGWQGQVPIATSVPTANAGQKISPNADGHIGMYIMMDPKGVNTSVLMQIGELKPSTAFAGGASTGLQGTSVRKIIETSDQMLQPKGEPYTLNELALEVARWGRFPDQLADIAQKASFAFDDKLRTGSFGRDDPSISLGVGKPTVRQLTNLTEPYDPKDPASKTLIEKYRDTCHSLVIEAKKRGEETVAAAAASADPFEQAKLMGLHRPEDPVDGTPDAEARKIVAEQKKVDRIVKSLIDFGTKPVGKGKETGDVLLKYMLEIWLPREGQLIIDPGKHDSGIHVEDGIPIKTSSLIDGSRVRNIADANVGDEMQSYVSAVQASRGDAPENNPDLIELAAHITARPGQSADQIARVFTERRDDLQLVADNRSQHERNEEAGINDHIDSMVKRAVASYKPYDELEFAKRIMDEKRKSGPPEVG